MTPKQLKRHLENEAYKFEQKILSETYIAPESMTLEQFAKEWKTKWLEKEVTENTIVLRLSSLNNHILPVLGHLKMNKISTLMLLDLMENLSRKDGKKGDLSVSTKQEIHKVLVSLFKRAKEWGVIETNPMLDVKMPKESKQESKSLNAYDLNEIFILLHALENEAPQWKLFVNLAIATGLRRGELLGLEWKHIDFTNKTLFVEQMIAKSRTGPVIKPPKNDSHRIITIPNFTIDQLKKFKKYSEEEREELQIYSNKHDWIFFNEKGEHYYPGYPTTWWRRFMNRLNKKRKKQNLKPLRYIRLHDLRHTLATLLISSNIHEKIIGERLGHKKTSTTIDIYSHVLPSADREASNKLDEILRKLLNDQDSNN